ncbi:MAG: glycosyltransferase family 2 protein [Clostridia bacterium]|nr:glycosyltransferase family 2 protein [Clostridia bacterium]
MKFVLYFNLIISMIFTLCYFYQLVYVVVGLFKKNKSFKTLNNHRYAVVVSARNESAVIQQLIQSIKEQNYPSELVDIFVVADNCTDNTAAVAREMGAIVYERYNRTHVGKGYALDWLFDKIKTDYPNGEHEAFIIFDADNVVAPDFIAEMNTLFDNGYRIITSYRNSKNYGENWITAGYSLWFLREAKFLNNARMKLGTSCAISGTGFLVSREVIEQNGGWKHHLLTEDIEFTTDSIINGEKIGYCHNAVIYDEQPTTFHQSYLQRLRWSKGFYQVFCKYSKNLLKGTLKGSFSCYDMLMTTTPAMLLTLISVSMNILAILYGMMSGSAYLPILGKTLLQTFAGFYGMFFGLGFLTTITEWHKIHCDTFKKIAYTFTFPMFMFTYVPISILALFKKVKWEPIKHSVDKSLTEICKSST